MTKQVNVHEAKTHLSALLAETERGEDIVIARDGKPIARLIAIAEPSQRTLGFLPAHVPDTFFEPLPLDELDAWNSPA